MIEKCLEYFGQEDKANIVHELLSVPRFEQLLQDEFANYVILSALDHAKVCAQNTNLILSIQHRLW